MDFRNTGDLDPMNFLLFIFLIFAGKIYLTRVSDKARRRNR